MKYSSLALAAVALVALPTAPRAQDATMPAHTSAGLPYLTDGEIEAAGPSGRHPE
jgi:hypothetical protein